MRRKRKKSERDARGVPGQPGSSRATRRKPLPPPAMDGVSLVPPTSPSLSYSSGRLWASWAELTTPWAHATTPPNPFWQYHTYILLLSATSNVRNVIYTHSPSLFLYLSFSLFHEVEKYTHAHRICASGHPTVSSGSRFSLSLSFSFCSLGPPHSTGVRSHRDLLLTTSQAPSLRTPTSCPRLTGNPRSQNFSSGFSVSTALPLPLFAYSRSMSFVYSTDFSDDMISEFLRSVIYTQNSDLFFKISWTLIVFSCLLVSGRRFSCLRE